MEIPTRPAIPVKGNYDMRSLLMFLHCCSIAAMLQGGAALSTSNLQAQATPDWRTGYYQGREVTYQVVDGLAIYEGDIILGTAAELEAQTLREAFSPGFHRLSSFQSPARFWPNGVVPYTVDAAVPNQQRIADAVAYYAENTPVRYVPRTTETNYVNFVRTTRGDSICSASIGMIGGRQVIMTEDTCTVPTLVHEMGHTIGFFHEQARKDRNASVTVLYENINKTFFGDFSNSRTGEQDLGFYDFASQMHYTATASSRNGDLTIGTVPAGIPLTEPQYYSAGDLETLRRLYGTAPATVTVTSNPIGLQIRIDGTIATTPATFDWAPFSQHTLEAPGPQTLSISANVRYQFGVWSDGGAQAHSITSTPSVAVYSASFVRQLRVAGTVLPVGSGTVNIEPSSGDGFYTAFTTIRFQAVPAAGFSFRRWSNSTGQSCPTVTLTGAQGNSSNPVVARPSVTPLGCVANFTRSTVTTIASDPPGRQITVDGTAASAPANFDWTDGSSHTIATSTPVVASTATVRYIFTGWSDRGTDSHTVTASPGSTITARFTTQYQFAVFNPPAAQGSISLNPPSTDGYYDSGTQVQVTATAAAGFFFTGWGTDLGGTRNPQSMVVNEQKAVSASFSRTAPTLVAVNAATFKPGPVSAGEIVTIFGDGIGPPSLVGLALDASGRVASTLSGTQVLFDGVAAPIIYASANQTSAIVPYAVAGKSSTVLQVVYQGRRSPSVNLAVTSSQPGFFTLTSSGQGLAAIINQDGTVNSASNPAPRGSFVSFYVTGEGQTGPAGTDGRLAAVPLPAPLLAVAARIGGKPSQVQYAGGAPGLVAGVMQVNAQIPNDLLPGVQSLYVVVGEAISPPGVVIAIK